jgi:catechol 2,3-dioxygenase-like lactoylglutathione lyase family enzyme
MSIRRVVPDIASTRLDESRDFYVGLLGFRVVMDLGTVVTLASPTNPTAQITLMRPEGSPRLLPEVTIEVGDVDAVHAEAVRRGLEIPYPLTDEPWGVRRFFVRDPNGTVLNVMCHRPTTP